MRLIEPAHQSDSGLPMSAVEAWHRTLQPTPNRPVFDRISSILPERPSPQEGAPQGEIVGVIVETRRNQPLSKVVKQAITRGGLDVIAFHGSANRQFLQDPAIERFCRDRRVIPHELATKSLSLAEYNALLLSAGFWAFLAGYKKVVIFQTDAFFCPGAKWRLRAFRHFDYVGTPWDIDRPIGIQVTGGCGGFSFRDVALSQLAIKQMSPTTWPGGEDSFFATAIAMLGGKVGSARESQLWGAQKSWRGIPVGGHQPWQLGRWSRVLLKLWCYSSRGVNGR